MALQEGTTQIGNAVITTDTDDPDSQAASFYVIAYDWNDETVISYRGTRFPDSGPDMGDVGNGWTLSAGYAPAGQPLMALDFYSGVEANVANGNDIVLTGHSLGAA